MEFIVPLTPASTHSLNNAEKNGKGRGNLAVFLAFFPKVILKVDTQTETIINITTKTLASKIRLLMWSGFYAVFLYYQ